MDFLIPKYGNFTYWPSHPSGEANDHASSTLKLIKLYKELYRDLFVKFNVNRYWWWLLTYTLNHIHKWTLQPFSQDYDIASSYVVCVNFIHDWRDLQFKVDSDRQIFEKLLMAIFLHLEFLPEICWEEFAEKNFHIYVPWDHFFRWSSFWSTCHTHYQPQSWCRLTTSELRFDTVGVLFVGWRQR